MTRTRDAKRMREAVKFLQGYMAGYSRQPDFESYAVETLIDDVLYGLGIAIDGPTYEYAQGFDRFKAFLLEHLKQPASA